MAIDRDREAGELRAEQAYAVLAELERSRKDRWLIGLTLVLASLAVISLSLLGPDLVDVGPFAIYSLLGATFLYGASVIREERRSTRITRDVIAERERHADLIGQVSVLEALDLATRRVTDAEDLPEVVQRILQAAQGLVGADAGAVLLRGAEGLTVAVSAGQGALPRGHLVGPDHVATEVLTTGFAQRVGPAGAASDEPVGVAAPLRLGERLVGVVVLQRAAGQPGFLEREAVVLERFGAHAARALRQTSHLDARRRADVTAVDAGSRSELDDDLERLRTHLDELVREGQPDGDPQAIQEARATLSRLERTWRELTTHDEVASSAS